MKRELSFRALFARYILRELDEDQEWAVRCARLNTLCIDDPPEDRDS